MTDQWDKDGKITGRSWDGPHGDGSYEYNPDGTAKATVNRPDGTVNTYSYDAQGNLTGST